MNAVLPRIDLRLRVNGQRLRVGARAWADPAAQPLTAVLEFERKRGDGQAWLSADPADFHAWSSLLQFGGIGLQQGTGEFKAWVDLRDHRVVMVTTDADLQNVQVRGVTLADGTRIAAKRVIDCRPFRASEHLAGGWQVFLGQHFRCEEPHGLTRPVIMDASVDQIAPYGNGAAYRFVYVLPLSPTEVFVEDTYYADQPKMDADVLKGRVAEYAHRRGWKGEVIDQEAGILPVVSGGNFAAAQAEIAIPGVALAGARGGFSHPLTSYTLPFAADNALAIAQVIAKRPDLSGEELAAFCARRAKRHWRATGYYRMLSRMLFEAAEPDKRVVVFEHFYALRGRLVERFYAGRSTWPDRLRILTGKPPVAIPRAIRALFSSGTPLDTKPLTMETPA